MKKIITLAALAVTTFMFSQEDSKPLNTQTISLNAMAGDPGQFGLTYEAPSLFKNKGSEYSTIINLSYGVMNYQIDDVLDIDGSGFVIEFGSRRYFNDAKIRKGFYSGNYFSYGSIKFDENTAFGKFDGTYSYFSFFSPEVGYKIVLGNISIDPYIGAMWKIEIKGKGDIDNNYTDEWAVRAGVKIGYSF
jgi:hypothetical protein